MNPGSSTPIQITPNNTPGQPITPFRAVVIAYFLLVEHAKGIHLGQIVEDYAWVHTLLILVPIIGFVMIYLLKQSTHSLNGASVWIENMWTVLGEFGSAWRKFWKSLMSPRRRPAPRNMNSKNIAPVATAKNQRGPKKTPPSRTSGSRRST